MATKTDLVVALVTFTHGTSVIHAGEALNSDDLAVAKNPKCFAPANLPTRELEARRSSLLAGNTQPVVPMNARRRQREAERVARVEASEAMKEKR